MEWWFQIGFSMLMESSAYLIAPGGLHTCYSCQPEKTLHFTSLNLFLFKISFLVNNASLSLSSTVLNPLVAVINYIFPELSLLSSPFPPPTCPIVFWWADLRCIWFVSTLSVKITSLFLKCFFSRSNPVWQMFPLGKSKVHVSQSVYTGIHLH